MQLGQQVSELEAQLGLMEQQCHSLDRDKQHLEEEVHDGQAHLDQAKATALQNKTESIAAQRTWEVAGHQKLLHALRYRCNVLAHHI